MSRTGAFYQQEFPTITRVVEDPREQSTRRHDRIMARADAKREQQVRRARVLRVKPCYQAPRLSERARRLVLRAQQYVSIRSTAGPARPASLGTTKIHPERGRTKEPSAQQVPEVALALAMTATGRVQPTAAQARRYRKNRNRAAKRAVS